MLIRAKYASVCAHCRGAISVGATVHYIKGYRATHEGCGRHGPAPEAVDPKRPHECETPGCTAGRANERWCAAHTPFTPDGRRIVDSPAPASAPRLHLLTDDVTRTWCGMDLFGAYDGGAEGWKRETTSQAQRVTCETCQAAADAADAAREAREAAIVDTLIDAAEGDVTGPRLDTPEAVQAAIFGALASESREPVCAQPARPESPSEPTPVTVPPAAGETAQEYWLRSLGLEF